MAKIIPFQGIRYIKRSKNLKNLICPPYDVISGEQRKKLVSLSPENFVNIELPESNKKAKKYLDGWLKKSILTKEKTPSIYLYQQEFDLSGKKFKRTGFFAGLELDERFIHRHEKTIQKHIDHRFELTKEVKVNTSPIFCIFPDKTKSITKLVLNISKKKKPLVFTQEDKEKITHRFWVINDKKLISGLTSKLEKVSLVIADGHHRCRTGLLYKELVEKTYGKKNNSAPYNYILAFLCAIEDPGLVLLPTHRVIRAYPDINEKIKKHFTLSPWDGKSKPQVACYCNGEFKVLTLKKTFAKNKNKLELSISAIVLQEFVLNETDPGNIFYTKDINEAVKKAQEIQGYAFLLEPPAISDVFALSEKGKIMPQKTTYFYPKVPAGLVVYDLEA
ncbi:MAG: hypothetical protein A3J83_01155 [Elusimicrobia bacterium RIFOXYA2_FULL_40_6]|nr:MAG: hypothetical protein A3J83_01155 [Elusimicrobia bacterium RIFOXYA2_FULL_40_6]